MCERVYRSMVWLAGALVAAAAASAGAQTTQAQDFQHGIPFDRWPSDPNNPIRRLFNDAHDNDGGLLWNSDSGLPRPDGAPDSATSVSITRMYTETCWTIPMTLQVCCVDEGVFTCFIVCHGPEGESHYLYQFAMQTEHCDDGAGNRSDSIIHDITSVASAPGSFDNVTIQGLLYVKTTQHTMSSTKVVVPVPAGASGRIAPCLAGTPSAASVEVVAAPGVAIDLTGLDGSSPICTTDTPAIIRADTILTDPGVTLNQLFSPPPQVLPGEARVDLKLTLKAYPRLQAPAPDVATYSIVSLGNIPVPVSMDWSDTLGWTPPGSAVLTLQPGEPQTFTVPLIYPFTGQPLDKTSLTLTATPLSTTGSPVSLARDIYFDSDLDGDGIKNTIDPCPTVFNAPSTPNPDGDFLPDVCDPCPGMFNFSPQDPPCSGPTCGSADFNGDGDIGTDSDIAAFFACLAGDCCPTCGSADFNGDGDLGTDADIESFFRVLGGGPC